MDEVEHKGLLYEGISKFLYSNPKVRRILSMLLDHFIICLSIVPLVIIISEVVSQLEHDSDKLIGKGLFFVLMFIYMNKDLLRGKSPSKRIMGYQVIDVKTNKPANEFQCFVRNLTIIGWPLEVIIALINPQRRLGDFLANTKVITSDKEKLKYIWNDLKNIKMKINFIGILILGGLFFYELNKLL